MGKLLAKKQPCSRTKKAVIALIYDCQLPRGTEQIVVCSDPEGTNSGSRSLFPNILSPLALRGRRREGREKGGGDGVAVWTRKVVALTLPREQLTSRGETEGQREGNEKGSVYVWSIGSLTE